MSPAVLNSEKRTRFVFYVFSAILISKKQEIISAE